MNPFKQISDSSGPHIAQQLACTFANARTLRDFEDALAELASDYLLGSPREIDLLEWRENALLWLSGE